jgi:hypothetical protein
MSKKEFIIRLDTELLEEIDATGKPRGTVMKEALEQYLRSSNRARPGELAEESALSINANLSDMKVEILEAIEQHSLKPDDIILPIRESLDNLRETLTNRLEQTQISYGELKNTINERYIQALMPANIIEMKMRKPRRIGGGKGEVGKGKRRWFLFRRGSKD